jgi:DNA polymerase-3 subunit epsilon
MLLLGLDLETSGLDPEKDRVLEVGLAHWDVERRRPVRQLDALVKPDIEIPEERWRELEPIHGIRREDVERYGRNDLEFIQVVARWAEQADVVVAHNGTGFDKLFLQAWQKRAGMKPNGWLWIDTRLDVPEPLTGSLICLAAKHGFLNPFPHQALSDVLTMLRILDSFDISKVIERAKIPNALVVACNLPFERKDEAKNRGYYWQQETANKAKGWFKLMKACDVEKEKSEATFQIRIVEG